MYDVLIRNGLIYDGSGRSPFPADIAVNGDTIAAIGRVEGHARQEIDAAGLAVSPGFINMMCWANESLIHDGRSQSDIRQGVTLEILGEGFSMGPVNDELKAYMKERQGDIQHLVEIQQLPVRIGRGPGLVQQPVLDLMGEDQRQAGDAQHQQEHGRDQTRPGVHPRPGADRGCLHGI